MKKCKQDDSIQRGDFKPTGSQGIDMPLGRSVRRYLAAVTLFVLLLLGTIGFVPPIPWRTAILFYKATGQVRDLDWSDLLRMLKPGSDIYLERMAETRNPYLAIESPRH